MTDAVVLRAKGYDGNFVENSTILQRVSSSRNEYFDCQRNVFENRRERRGKESWIIIKSVNSKNSNNYSFETNFTT